MIGVPDSTAPELCRVCRLQVAGLRLSGYAGLEVCWLPGATGLSGTPGLGGDCVPKAKSRLVVVRAKVDSVPS